MPSDDQILVTCTNGECPVRMRAPLLDLQTFILIHPDREIPTFTEAEASKSTVPCPACEAAEREGILVYLDDHLLESPPDKDALVPALLEVGATGVDALWKRAEEVRTVVGKASEWLPEDQEVLTGIVLEVRPYGGFMLRHGNNDDEPQYGDEPAGIPSSKPRYIRELKHDLLSMAYYGDRERLGHKGMGGSGVFEAMTVGAILALKFDLSFFYGVPTTNRIEDSILTDEQFRRVTLETFSGPIYFDTATIGDNPIEPIDRDVIRPLVEALGPVAKYPKAHQRLGEALDAYERSLAPDLKTKQRGALRNAAKEALNSATKLMKANAPKAIALPDTTMVVAVRKLRAVDDVLDHPHFAQTKRKPWETFASRLRTVATLRLLRSASHRASLQELVGAEGGTGALAGSAKAALARYDAYVAAVSVLDAAAVDDVVKIVGGLPETFEPYLLALREQSAVDHGTAIYIKSVLAGVKIGSSSGKVNHAGRKLVYRTVEGGIVGEPDGIDAFADLVIGACKGPDGKFTMPPFIMLERMKNESGFRATSRIRDLGLTKDERKASVPQMGIDWSNWGGSKFFFSELFTKSVARVQEHPGYRGPIVHSRGVGAGQVTLPTLMAGVSPKGRASNSYGFEWASGIPVSADNEGIAVPPHWSGAKGSIASASNLLRRKFTSPQSERRDCTFGNIDGGVRYDCSRCLARFDLGESGDIAHKSQGGKSRSFHCRADASRWPVLFGEELSEDNERGRTEYPCSWLRAVQLYAGSGEKSFARILKCTNELVSLADPTQTGGKDKTQALRAALERARRQL